MPAGYRPHTATRCVDHNMYDIFGHKLVSRVYVTHPVTLETIRVFPGRMKGRVGVSLKEVQQWAHEGMVSHDVPCMVEHPSGQLHTWLQMFPSGTGRGWLPKDVVASNHPDRAVQRKLTLATLRELGSALPQRWSGIAREGSPVLDDLTAQHLISLIQNADDVKAIFLGTWGVDVSMGAFRIIAGSDVAALGFARILDTLPPHQAAEILSFVDNFGMIPHRHKNARLPRSRRTPLFYDRSTVLWRRFELGEGSVQLRLMLDASDKIHAALPQIKLPFATPAFSNGAHNRFIDLLAADFASGVEMPQVSQRLNAMFSDRQTLRSSKTRMQAMLAVDSVAKRFSQTSQRELWGGFSPAQLHGSPQAKAALVFAGMSHTGLVPPQEKLVHVFQAGMSVASFHEIVTKRKISGYNVALLLHAGASKNDLERLIAFNEAVPAATLVHCKTSIPAIMKLVDQGVPLHNISLLAPHGIAPLDALDLYDRGIQPMAALSAALEGISKQDIVEMHSRKINISNGSRFLVHCTDTELLYKVSRHGLPVSTQSGAILSCGTFEDLEYLAKKNAIDASWKPLISDSVPMKDVKEFLEAGFLPEDLGALKNIINSKKSLTQIREFFKKNHIAPSYGFRALASGNSLEGVVTQNDRYRRMSGQYPT